MAHTTVRSQTDPPENDPHNFASHLVVCRAELYTCRGAYGTLAFGDDEEKSLKHPTECRQTLDSGRAGVVELADALRSGRSGT